VAKLDCVAIRRSTTNATNGHASRTDYILDQDRLSKLPAHALDYDSANCVSWAAGWSCGHDGYDAVWKNLRRSATIKPKKESKQSC
jgi:hypothetical protein